MSSTWSISRLALLLVSSLLSDVGKSQPFLPRKLSLILRLFSMRNFSNSRSERRSCEADFDLDLDGFIDDCDACLDSDLAKLIVVEECPTGVPNELLDDGCTMNDVLSECSVGAHSHGELTACVARHANEWRRQGLLSGKDVGRIVRCAAASNDPRPSKWVKDDGSHGRR